MVQTPLTDVQPKHDLEIDLVQEPEVRHGTDMWRIACDSEVLDVNSSYAYLILCRDFRQTTRVAVVDGEVAGFITGYIPFERDDTLFVWQIAVDDQYRGRGLASRMLDDLAGSLEFSHGIRLVETTITDDNRASQRLFESFAERWNDAEIQREPLFVPEHFPDDHHTEYLYTIGPRDAAASITDAVSPVEYLRVPA